MTQSKSFLINTSIAALVSAFVFATNISSASAWGDNDQYGHGTTASTPAKPQLPTRPQTPSKQSSSSSGGWDQGGGYGGGNTKTTTQTQSQGQTGQTQTGCRYGCGGSANTQTGGYGGDNGGRPQRQTGGVYGGDDRPSRGPIYRPGRGPYVDNGDYYPDRRPRRPIDDGYGDRRHGDDDYQSGRYDRPGRIYRPHVDVTWEGRRGGDWNSSGGYGGR